MTRPLRDARIPRSEEVSNGRVGPPTRYVTRTPSRPRSSAQILESASTTTRRDLYLCLDLFEHRVLTTHQIFELRFPSLRRAQRRLLILQQRGMVDRFRPFRPTGSHPWHYILGAVGLDIVASARGLDHKKLGISRDRLRAMAHSPRLPHLIEVNGFFTRLARRCRMDHGLKLVEWWSERRCVSEWGGIVRPDGLGRLQGPRLDLRFFLELDRGTETTSALEEKLARYARVSRFSDSPGVLLFLFPTERREAEARSVLFNCGMIVLTASKVEFAQDPLSSCWLPMEGDRRDSILNSGA
jgi:hypothetical protein